MLASSGYEGGDLYGLNSQRKAFILDPISIAYIPLPIIANKEGPNVSTQNILMKLIFSLFVSASAFLSPTSVTKRRLLFSESETASDNSLTGELRQGFASWMF